MKLSGFILSILPLGALGSDPAPKGNSSWPWTTFRSSKAQAPFLRVEKSGRTEPGLLFFSPIEWKDHARDHLAIMSDENELVWQVAGEYGAFKPQVLFGKPVLVYWTGSFLPLPWGTGLGHVEILDDTYTKIHSVKISGKEHNIVPAAGLDPEKIPSFVDGHEAYISSENTLVVGAFNVTPYDLSAFGGPVDGWMHDSLMFELDVKTGKVLNRWSALDHIGQLGVPYGDLKYPLDDMGRNITHPYRFFHMNSANKLSDGSYLVSSRQLCSVYRIAPNGTVQWILQGEGKKSSFKHGPGVSFCYQHDARVVRESDTSVTISLFNNKGVPSQASNGLLIVLNTVDMTATLERGLFDPKHPVNAPFAGSVQTWEGGNTLVGYGYIPKMKEYDTAGNVVMSVQWEEEGNASAYRSYRHTWVGRPANAPDVYACYDGTHTRVYMSWNGSTEHTSWSVKCGCESRRMRHCKSVPSTGFETVCNIRGKKHYVKVEPKGGNRVSVSSRVVRVDGKC